AEVRTRFHDLANALENDARIGRGVRHDGSPKPAGSPASPSARVSGTRPKIHIQFRIEANSGGIPVKSWLHPLPFLRGRWREAPEGDFLLRFPGLGWGGGGRGRGGGATPSSASLRSAPPRKNGGG